MTRLLAELRWRRRSPTVAIGGRWADWAGALIARHARAEAPPRRAGTSVLAASGGRAGATVVALQFSPRIHLALQRPVMVAARHRPVLGRAAGAPATRATPDPSVGRRRALRPPAGGAGYPGSPAPAPPVAAADPPATRPGADAGRPPAAAAAAREVARRVAHQRRRVEEPPGRRSQSTRGLDALGTDSMSPERSGEQPAATERWRPSARPIGVLRAPAAGPAASETPPAAARRGAAPAPPAVPPLDLERLTDQVVRQIDRRIVAHRERSGRI